VHGQPAATITALRFSIPSSYFSDGQIKGEVYEYGSFIQSPMYHAGVTCSDCHNPHNRKLRAEGNALCTRCHSPSRFDSPTHQFHKVGSDGSRWVSCHMPSRIYMVVDARRDHSLRIPRPELSTGLGTPNACSNCHQNQSASWAAGWITRWYGGRPKSFQLLGPTLQAGRLGSPGAPQILKELQTRGSLRSRARARSCCSGTMTMPARGKARPRRPSTMRILSGDRRPRYSRSSGL
jgi:predicted CXXCH cytochrome family protein